MNLVPSLLRAIVDANGDAMVVHAGEKPYVVSPGGQVEIGSRVLTQDVVGNIIAQLLPAELRHALDDIGTVEYELPPQQEFPHESFSVAASSEGDDLWVELRRTRASGTAEALEVAEIDAKIVELEGAATAPDPAPAGDFLSQDDDPEAQPGIVLPMSRNPIRADMLPVRPDSSTPRIERLLQTAAARGASTLYLLTGERPALRVDGELQTMDKEAALSPSDVVTLLITLMPDRGHEALRAGATTEWISDVQYVGRVRCQSFNDHRGPGGVFRLMPVRAASAEELALSREIQALAIEPEGLVLVVGPRSSGKRTIIAALVDLINRRRRDHVITIEREVSIVHPRGSSYISQREAPGSDDDMLTAARAALREDPDVLVIEQIRTGGMMNVALEAAASGHLVIAGFAAHDAPAAIDRILDLYPPAHIRQVQLSLADTLRGIVAQVLLRRNGGGRVAARELLLNTSVVGRLIAEGRTSQLPMAIDGGRSQGMVPLSDPLVAFVRNGTVGAREAYRHVTDRGAFLARLEREGVDTSFVERLA